MQGLIQFWPVITWIIGTVFALGMMWWKVESARMAVNILFKKVDELEKYAAKHDGELEALKETLRRMENSVASNVIRTDQIYALLTKQGKN